ncbi:hypothetical protein GGX14DRAFT_535970 [Mycena pura]|uniref:Tc1-like transposase DDE domain-containing protein n=1 Tax=Mycena pura TaxID=153505 RepID=A0AAD6YCR7_9AGAR|nr:hypothetical protein GGX14DRAFT_535970 [Mycena pura]
MLSLYTNPKSVTTYEKWRESAQQAAWLVGGGTGCARRIAELARAFIADRQVRPINPYGEWMISWLSDEGLVHDIRDYLRTLGDGIKAEKLQEYMNQDDIIAKYQLDGTISVRTARRYLNQLGYSYSHAKKGQYTDGHKREDILKYQNEVYLPTLKGYEDLSWVFYTDGTIELTGIPPGKQPTCPWYHDESILYHRHSSAKPYKKGDGGGYMNKDGYFTSEDIEEQAIVACFMYDHIFIYDNATTHCKHSPGALSASGMPKFTSGPRVDEDEAPKKTKWKTIKKTPPAKDDPKKKPRKPRNPPEEPEDVNFLVSVNKRNPDNSLMHNEHGKLAKEKIQMTRATFADGTPQDLYYPDDVMLKRQAREFKGMAVILEERRARGDLGDGLSQTELASKLAQCKGFKCPTVVHGAHTTCCMRRMLYNEPDFANVQSCLESACAPFGVAILFLPKFRPELNPIEMVWGFAKWIYRENPESSHKDILEQNMLAALDAVPLMSIRRFVLRAQHFGDAYRHGLTGAEASWAARTYKGHQLLPLDFRAALDEEYEHTK